MSECSGPGCQHLEHHKAGRTHASSTEGATLGELVAQSKVDAEEAALATSIAARFPPNRAGRRAAERAIAKAIVAHRAHSGRIWRAANPALSTALMTTTVEAIAVERARELPMPSVVPPHTPWWRRVLDWPRRFGKRSRRAAD